jgi:hypothetical protein
MHNQTISIDQRCLTASIHTTTDDKLVTNIANIYAPAQTDSPEKKLFFQQMHTWPELKNISDEPWLLLGDYNLNIHQPAPSWLQDWHRWRNDYLINLGSAKTPTFYRAEHRSTIDYIMISKELSTKTTNFSQHYLPSTWTDHHLLQTDLILDQKDIGPGSWRLNPTILAQKEYVDLLKILLPMFFVKVGNDDNPIDTWEQLKTVIQISAKDFSLHHQKNTPTMIKYLEEKRSTICTKIQDLADTPREHRSDLEHDLHQVEQQLDVHIDRSTQQLLLRSATRWHEKGERNNKYFYRVIKQRTTQQTILSLKDSRTGQRVTNTSDILEEARRFYRKLYRPTDVDHNAIDSLLSHIPDTATLDTDASTTLIQPVSEMELEGLIDHSPLGKSPGLDGLPFELYKLLFSLSSEAAALFRRVLDLALDGRFPHSWTSTRMILLFKKGDPELLKNWRPLSLINTDAKLFTKMIANRLNVHLPNMINPYQTGFMPGRLISDNGWVTTAIMQHYQQLDHKEQIPAVAACFDQEKAYDRVHPEYLTKTLLRFGFPISLVKSLHHLFFDTQISLSINGWLGSPFRQLRGLRQGDPLSPLLFNLAFEPFLRTLLAAPTLQGIRLDHPQVISRHKQRLMTQPPATAQATQAKIKLLAYADDLLIFFKDTSEWATAKSLFELYSQASNSKVNLQKTYLVSLSGEPYEEWNVLCNTEQLEWHDKSKTTAIRYLGFPLSSSKNQLEAFLADTLDKIRRHTNILHARNMSIKGTSLVANSLLLSRLWHLLRVITVPEKWLHQVRKMIHRFVAPFWPFPSWSTICQKRNRGGLNVVDIYHQQLALQLVYIQRMARNDPVQDFCTSIANDLIKYYSGTVGWANIGRNNGSIKKLVKNLPCLSTICSIYTKLPAIPPEDDIDTWCLQLSPIATRKVTEASPGDLRKTLHPDHHWILTPPRPPQRIPLGWRLSTQTWTSFWQIKMSHKATTIWWRLLQDCLSTKERMQQRSLAMIDDATCSHCSRFIENDQHFFLGCPTKDHVWLDLWPGPSFPPSQHEIWKLLIRPNSKDRPLLEWLGKVLLVIWTHHWSSHHNSYDWNKEAVVAAFYNLV